jgi:hypothetical protein
MATKCHLPDPPIVDLDIEVNLLCSARHTFPRVSLSRDFSKRPLATPLTHAARMLANASRHVDTRKMLMSDLH